MIQPHALIRWICIHSLTQQLKLLIDSFALLHCRLALRSPHLRQDLAALVPGGEVGEVGLDLA